MKKWFLILLVLLTVATGARADILPPEKLLPRDTVFVATIPDAAKARAVFTNAPYGKLWHDPALKPFVERLSGKFKSDMLEPMERAFGIKFSDYQDLAQGQVTLAVVADENPENTNSHFARIILLDAKDKSDQLKKNLAEVKKKWTDSGKKSKTAKIRDVEFTTLISTSDEMSNTWAKVFPASTNQPSASADDKDAEKGPSPNVRVELTFGQADSLLIVGDSPRVIEKLLSRQAGGLVPALEEQLYFQADFAARLHGAPVYLWINAKALMDNFLKDLPTPEHSKGSSLNPLTMKPDKALAAMGLTALTTASFDYRDTPDGMMSQLYIGVPEFARRGLVKALAAAAKDANPPPFVPSDVVKFSRWRLDVAQGWTTIEKMLNEINPSAAGIVSMVLSLAGKDKDDKYDLKAELLGSLGDDILSYEKNPRSDAPDSTNSAPSIYLIGSPNPDKLAAAIKVGLDAVTGRAGGAKEREFQGRKITTIKFSDKSSFSFAASGGYVAMSSDDGMLEEFLHSSENKPKALADLPGLNEAAQKIGGMSKGLFSFSNESENMRLALDELRRNPSSLAEVMQSAGLLGKINSPDQLKKLTEWMDGSLLPPFDSISKYFYFSVYTGSFNADGFQMNFFSPTPPQLK